jgi:hypothetical protein
MGRLLLLRPWMLVLIWAEHEIGGGFFFPFLFREHAKALRVIALEEKGFAWLQKSHCVHLA